VVEGARLESVYSGNVIAGSNPVLSAIFIIFWYDYYMKILYVRHGKSMANADGTIGTPTTPLAEEGLEQARITGQNLKSQNVTAIVCSPYMRAQQTAEVIAGELGIASVDITIIDELHERRMGELEGQPKTHESAFFVENDTSLGFEPQAALISRLEIALDKVKKIAAATAGTTVVVGHAASGLYFLQIAKGKRTFKDFEPASQMKNAEFVDVDIA
jgi:broad specificity phosphatase PhoE